MVCSASVTRHIQALGVYPPRVSALNSYIRIIRIIRIFLMFHNVDEEETRLFLDERIIGCGNETDDFQIADLKKRYEYKKRRNRLVSIVTYHLPTTTVVAAILSVSFRWSLRKDKDKTTVHHFPSFVFCCVSCALLLVYRLEQ